MGRRAGKQDITLMILVMVLVAFGLVTLYSTSAWNGQVKFQDSAYYFKKQFFATLLGLAAMFLISRMDYHIFERYAVHAYILSLILSGLVLLIGDSYNGSKRWLSLGPLSFQPAEFAKLAVILFLSKFISSRKQKKKKGGIFSLIRVMFLILPIVGLVGTNNLSTAIIILSISSLFFSNRTMHPNSSRMRIVHNTSVITGQFSITVRPLCKMAPARIGSAAFFDPCTRTFP